MFASLPYFYPVAPAIQVLGLSMGVQSLRNINFRLSPSPLPKGTPHADLRCANGRAEPKEHGCSLVSLPSTHRHPPCRCWVCQKACRAWETWTFASLPPLYPVAPAMPVLGVAMGVQSLGNMDFY